MRRFCPRMASMVTFLTCSVSCALYPSGLVMCLGRASYSVCFFDRCGLPPDFSSPHATKSRRLPHQGSKLFPTFPELSLPQMPSAPFPLPGSGGSNRATLLILAFTCELANAKIIL